MKFAVHKLDLDNPAPNRSSFNWYVNGLGNSTVAKIDGGLRLGFAPDHGKWASALRKARTLVRRQRAPSNSNGIFYPDRHHQPSEPIEIAGKDDKAPQEYASPQYLRLVRCKIHTKTANP